MKLIDHTAIFHSLVQKEPTPHGKQPILNITKGKEDFCVEYRLIEV